MPFNPHQTPRPRRPIAAPVKPNTQTAAAPRDGSLLYTPAEAAQLLKVRESWLRRKAGARQVPCTFLGRHLRFSPTDLATIVTAAAQPPVGRHRAPRGRKPADRDLIAPPHQSVDPPRPDDHNHAQGSNPWPG